MGASTADELKQQLRLSGRVDIALHRGKLVFGLVLLIGVPTAFIIGFGSESTLHLVIAVAGSLFIWVSIGLTLPEWVLGAGPMLQVTRDGVTIRRWRQPLHWTWTDFLAVSVRHQPRGPLARWIGPGMQITMSEWVWHDYRASRHRLLVLADGWASGRRTIIPYKLFTVPHSTLIEFLSPELVAEMTAPRPPYRLVVDFAEEGQTPLWFRGGRNAGYDAVPLPAELRAELEQWKSKMLALADEPPSGQDGQLDTASFDQRLKPLIEETRTLAARCQQALGAGAEVLASPDVPVWKTR